MTHFIEVGRNLPTRSIAVDILEGQGKPVVWLCGFLSEMASVKGKAMLQWAKDNGRPLIRFDYSGHGQTGGDYTEFTVSHWLEEALAVIGKYARQPPVLVGSSMGGWIATLTTLALRREKPHLSPSGLVLIAPAIDFTERLVWGRMPEKVQQHLMATGSFDVPSEYSDTPYRFTRQFIEDGRSHLLLGQTVETGCPVHILQGMNDNDVPWQHAMAFARCLAQDKSVITLIPDGDHRLSRDEDITAIIRAVSSL